MREEGLPDIYREHSDGEGEKCTKASRLQRKGRGCNELFKHAHIGHRHYVFVVVVLRIGKQLFGE